MLAGRPISSTNASIPNFYNPASSQADFDALDSESSSAIALDEIDLFARINSYPYQSNSYQQHTYIEHNPKMLLSQPSHFDDVQTGTCQVHDRFVHGDATDEEEFSGDAELDIHIGGGGHLDQAAAHSLSQLSEQHTPVFNPLMHPAYAQHMQFQDVSQYSPMNHLPETPLHSHLQSPMHEQSLASPLLPSPAPTRGSSPNSLNAAAAAHGIHHIHPHHSSQAPHHHLRPLSHLGLYTFGAPHLAQRAHPLLHPQHQFHPNILGDHGMCQYQLPPIPTALDYPYGYPCYPEETLNAYSGLVGASSSGMDGHSLGGIAGSELMMANPRAHDVENTPNASYRETPVMQPLQSSMSMQSIKEESVASISSTGRRRSDAGLKLSQTQAPGPKRKSRRPSMAKMDSADAAALASAVAPMGSAPNGGRGGMIGSAEPGLHCGEVDDQDNGGVGGSALSPPSGGGMELQNYSNVEGGPFANVERKRRRQVKVACTHCKKACKKCDDQRPCSRCIRLNLGPCCDAPRKERRKGFKRGPYNKRKDGVKHGGSGSGSESPTDSDEIEAQISRSSPHKLAKLSQRRASMSKVPSSLSTLSLSSTGHEMMFKTEDLSSGNVSDSNVHYRKPNRSQSEGLMSGSAAVAAAAAAAASAAAGNVMSDAAGLFSQPITVYSPSVSSINFAS
ncbi:hypothetical protein HDU97_000554 [Phlyctochytrium planicorne]|nr:hypothetical protein HDU97_000554 [Phlyctochytrium planicorne]